MSNHPIIKALQEELAKERDGLAEAYSYNQWAERKPEADDTFLNYKSGHEASSAFWLPLIEKAVEGLEYFRKLESSDNVSYDANIGKKAREFLNTLADASGEMNKESNSGK